VARRPDIVAARERVEAASRRSDVARADFFPAIRLDALIGLQSIGLSGLFESDSTYGRVGPAVNLPIFHGGALKGRYRASRATYDEAVAHYDATVLGAYRELAEIMTRRAAAARRLSYARDALTASDDAYRIAMLRYRGGLSTYMDALSIEDRLLDARLAVSNLEAEARTLDLELIRALGGGFRIEGQGPAGETIDG
jgi:outer membrane protein TolC